MSSKTRDPLVTSRIMTSVRSRDTRAEVRLRSALWKMGLRYRKNASWLLGKPDIVFPSARVAIFVDGDFWHGNAWRIRRLHSLEDLFPNRTEWWTAKIRRNMARDEEVTRRLMEQGWCVLRYWESRILQDTPGVAAEIARHVRAKMRRSEMIVEEPHSSPYTPDTSDV